MGDKRKWVKCGERGWGEMVCGISYCKIECERKEFIDALIESELINGWDELKQLNWTIFERVIS